MWTIAGGILLAVFILFVALPAGCLAVLLFVGWVCDLLRALFYPRPPSQPAGPTYGDYSHSGSPLPGLIVSLVICFLVFWVFTKH